MSKERKVRRRRKELDENMEKAAESVLEYLSNSGSEDMEDALSTLLGRIMSKVLDAEMDMHMGYDKGGLPPVGQANRRNGHSAKTVRSSLGPVDIDVPRDREGSFEPRMIPKYKRDVMGFDQKILSLYAKGMSVRDIHTTVQELYGAEVSPAFISHVTDSINQDVREWRSRPLEKTYYIVYVDAIFAKTRETGSVSTRAVYTVVGVLESGKKDVLGFYVHNTESAKTWMGIFKDLKDRGIQRIAVLVADGLKGMKEAVNAIFPGTEFQTCVVHMIRNSTKFVPYKDKKQLLTDLKKVYNALNESEARFALSEFKSRWDEKYPMVSQIWERRWDEWTPFLELPQEARRAIYTTNAIEGLHRRLRKVIKTRGAFPSDEALLKVLFLALKDAKRTWGNPSPYWHKARLQLAIHFNLMEEI